MAPRSKFFRLVLPLVVLVVGIAGMRVLLHARKPPVRAVAPHPGPLVEVVTVHAADHRVTVHATGTIEPARAVSITPEVTGRVVEVAPNLVAGGLFREGELLFAIEATDYRLAVEQAKAQLAKVRVELTTTEGRAKVARNEWRSLHPNGEEAPPLVVYAPQLASAKAAVAAAEASVAEAELNLARTRISAPFNGRIRSEEVEIGQVVRPGSPVAQVAGTDRVEVVVPLGDEALAALTIPHADGSATDHGSAATVAVSSTNHGDPWLGRVIRSLGEVDPTSRMGRVVVAVDDPYQLRRRDPRRADLEVGRFVEIALTGATLTGVVEIPRRALGPGSRVEVVGEDDRLTLRTVSVAWREGESLFVDHGLADGDRLLLTRLPGAADGMVVRPVEAKAGGGMADAEAADTVHTPAVAGDAPADHRGDAPAEGGR